MRLELTSRSSYAIRAVIAIARSERGEPSGSPRPVPMSRIAEEMAIPRRFLPQVMGDLVRAGIVTAQVGRGGGYSMSRPPAGLPLLTVVEASEGDTRGVRCVLRGVACGVDGTCEVHAVFEGARSALRDRLLAATIADILAQDERSTVGRQADGEPAAAMFGG